MAVSDAQKRSAQKWDAANLDRVSIAMPKGMKDTVKAAAAAVGESMNQYIIGATEQRMSGNLCKGTQNAAGAQEGCRGILTPGTLQTARSAAQNAGETVSAFVERAVNTQAQRDKAVFALERAKRKAPDDSGT